MIVKRRFQKLLMIALGFVTINWIGAIEIIGKIKEIRLLPDIMSN
jgi:hypothetical protein